MRFKSYDPGIWFLDENLDESAKMLTNEYLNKSIEACVQCLTSAYMYKYGIKNKRTFNYWFSKDKKQDTLDKYFPNWPFRALPTLVRFTSKPAKWTRKCLNHFLYVKSYLLSLLNEYRFRFNKGHKLEEFLSWVEITYPTLNLSSLQLNKIMLEYKCLPIKYRSKDILLGYKRYYKSKIQDPLTAYIGTKRNTPSFLLDGLIFV